MALFSRSKVLANFSLQNQVTYTTSEPATQANRPPHHEIATRQPTTKMRRQHNAQSIQKEGRLALALLAVQQNQIPSERRAAGIYNVPKSTLQERRSGITAQRDCEANSKKLAKLEESVIV